VTSFPADTRIDHRGPDAGPVGQNGPVEENGPGRVTVRRATPADAGALALLRWQWEAEYGTPPIDRESFLPFFARWVVDHMDSHVPFLAEIDDRPVGMAWLALQTRVPSPSRVDRPTGDVQSVYVAPERRDAGVGTVLIAAIVGDARTRGLTTVTVHSSHRAVPFYLRAGFQDGQRWLEWRP
jgi:GNAT superfamily N-acetyltransferase